MISTARAHRIERREISGLRDGPRPNDRTQLRAGALGGSKHSRGRSEVAGVLRVEPTDKLVAHRDERRRRVATAATEAAATTERSADAVELRGEARESRM